MSSTCSQSESLVASSELDRLVMLVSEKLANTESIDLDVLTADYPEEREQLERLLPTLEAMANLDHSIVSESFTQPHAAAAGPPRASSGMLGDFRILHELGRGGMGVVYEAEQISLGRRVALKVLPLAATLSPPQLERFKNEARAAATLKHPHIVGVYSVGVERGVHYYAMELVEGRSLAQAILELKERESEEARGQRLEVSRDTAAEQSEIRNHQSQIDTVAALSTVRTENPQDYFRRVAKLIADAADALDYAHNQGVVHRDIKPANLLIDQQSQVWITDFGLARLESEAGVTLTGDILGTLRYMSPEQAAGKPVMVDFRTDIHALGATLFELIALRPAFDCEDRAKLLQQISDKAPPALRQVDARVPTDLETIVAKTMEKEPADRYQSAGELATDLRAFAEDRAIAAKPPSLANRTQRWMRRHVALVTMLLGGSLLATVLLGVGMAVLNRARSQTAIALDDAQDSLQFARLAVDQMYSELASDWIAEDREITPTQRGFLEKALRIYQRLAEEARDDPQSQWEAGTSYGRVAQIQHKLGQYRQANSAYNLSIKTHEALLDAFVDDPDRRAELAASYQGLGALHAAHEKLPKAVAAWDSARELLEPLTRDYPNDANYRLAMVQNNLDRAALELREGRLDQAEQLTRQAVAFSEAAWKSERKSSDYQLAFQRSRVALSRVLRFQGNLDEAEKLASDAEIRLAYLANDSFDSRQLKQIQVAALIELADVQIAQERWEAANEILGRAQQKAQIALRSDVSPNMLMTYAITHEAEWARYAEPEAFRQFVEIEIRRGRTLGELNRFYESQQVLADAVRAAYVLRSTYPLPRFGVVEANARACLAELLRDANHAEDDAMAMSAARTWQRLLRYTPSTATTLSGVHTQADLDWFLEQFPDERASVYDQQLVEEPAHFNEGLVVMSVANGVSWYRGGSSADAVNFLADFAEADSGADSYGWFYLAMAYHQAGQSEQARKMYEQATKWLEQHNPNNVELVALRAEAAHLLGLQQLTADKSFGERLQP
ncbi:serine/threonine-protein kinase [Bythopirellula polymerisocia]|uniref:Serine/threonine-protein kinase PrkC n=1 Tax=Bythopirellula polymerisocia TaxID=2528003 RepID=A0A5C6D4I1_9BACT|nr:serine/threonine-protein kinase [Bythopirellula polymerisocia]TWU29759.1 Serine/threonine-protein kinase PrkC [Bythopirellula polymerisocia]